MKTPHKHAEMILEWALDTSRKLEFRSHKAGPWMDIEEPSWNTEYEYRFKPTPKTDYKTYAKVLNGFLQTSYIGKPNIEFIFDGETHDLKDAKVLK